MTNDIATAKFHVFGTTSWGHPVDKHIVIHLAQSGGFDYGNGMSVWVENMGEIDNYYDVRYDRKLKRDGSNYTEWVQEFVKDIIDQNLTAVMES